MFKANSFLDYNSFVINNYWMRLSMIRRIGHFWVPKTLTFKMRLGAQPFLWKWVLFAWEWKIISISKAEHLPSFRNRGPGKLGNDLLFSSTRGYPHRSLFVFCCTCYGSQQFGYFFLPNMWKFLSFFNRSKRVNDDSAITVSFTYYTPGL